MKGRTVIELIASALLVVFLYAAITQVVFYNTYYIQLNRSLSSAFFANIIIWSIPVVHILLGWLLWRPSTRLAGLIGVLALVSLYTIYFFIKLPAGSRSACQCGELWQQASLEINILFNLAVILLAAIAIILVGRLRTNSPRLT